MTAIVTIKEMYEADRLAIAGGIAGVQLMENAGGSIVSIIEERWHPCPVLVLCGPGNNGGDGFVIARLLAEKGWPVSLMLTGEVARLSGDAAIMAKKWSGGIMSVEECQVPESGLVVDALFGAGLARAITGELAALLERIAESNLSVLAVDVPSGLHGDTGLVAGSLCPADITVSFFRPKPGHFLADGPEVCGELIITDIGIPDAVLDNIAPKAALNDPDLWADEFPMPDRHHHKYEKGHALIFAGPAYKGGAARLAARAALRCGAGLVTMACPVDALDVNAARLDAIMLTPVDVVADVEGLLEDVRLNAAVIGPGFGPGNVCREYARLLIASKRGLVMDADALTSFSGNPDALFDWIRMHGDPEKLVMTPHEGEFRRLFGALPGSKLDRARNAAMKAGCVIILKGPDTIIATPDGQATINDHAVPALATAGSGDVLAGLVAGFMAQGVSAFPAALMAVWCHGDAGIRLGRGLIAEDLPEILPKVLQGLETTIDSMAVLHGRQDIHKKM